MTERIDIYIGVVVVLMFLAGCFLIILSARERTEERGRRGLDNRKGAAAPESDEPWTQIEIPTWSARLSLQLSSPGQTSCMATKLA